MDFREVNNKRGQVALFVILAIVLVAIILGVFLYKKYLDRESQGVELETMGVSSVQSQVFGSSVSDCLQRLTETGLELLGLQGGYIYLPAGIERGVFKNDENKSVVFRGEDLDFEINSEGYNEIPYWMNENQSFIPTKEFMEQELEGYLEMNMPACVNHFQELKDKGFSVEEGKILAEADLSNFVTARIKWKVIASDLDNQTFIFDSAEYRYPVNFDKVYDVALTLATNELLSGYLESHAKSLISLYSYAGGAKEEFDLPPFALTIPGQDCEPVSWTKSEVKQDLRSIFYKYYPYIKIANTRFTPFVTNGSAVSGVYRGFVFDFFDKPMPNVSIDFRYDPANELYLDIQPSSGDVLGADTVSQTGIPFLPIFCSLEYRYKYSLNVPVLVKIRDNDSIQYRGGYNFYFPMKASLCGNQARRCNPAPVYYNYTDVSLNDVLGEDVERKILNCSDLMNTTYNISVKTPDSLPAGGTDLIYSCDNFITDCFIGRTNSSGVVNVFLPKCSKPILTLHKKGYAIIKDPLQHHYELEEVRSYNITVDLVRASTFVRNYYLSNGFTQVEPNCTAVYGSADNLLAQTRDSLRKSSDRILIELSGGYSETPSLVYPLQNSMRLNSGRFNLSISYTGIVTIRPSKFEADDKDVTVSVNPSGKGNYNGLWSLGKNNLVWNLNKASLRGDKIKFYVLAEHYSDDSLEVKNLGNAVIQSNGHLVTKIKADKNCDGFNEELTIDLKPEDYNKFIAPEFS